MMLKMPNVWNRRWSLNMQLSFKFRSPAHHSGYLIPACSDCKYNVNNCVCEVRFIGKTKKMTEYE
jgi:hypothetical protein